MESEGEIFKEICVEVIRESSLPETEKKESIKRISTVHCQDQYVGMISKNINRNGDFIVRYNVEDEHLEVEESCGVIMILESPHRYEFRKGVSRGPARHLTGVRIRHCFHSVVGCNYDDCGLVLVNAVQFQCSLGCKRDSLYFKTCKNKVMREMLASKVIRDSLIRRITRATSLFKNCNVISACTLDAGKDLVSELIEEVRRRCPIRSVLEKPHPSSWPWP